MERRYVTERLFSSQSGLRAFVFEALPDWLHAHAVETTAHAPPLLEAAYTTSAHAAVDTVEVLKQWLQPLGWVLGTAAPIAHQPRGTNENDLPEPPAPEFQGDSDTADYPDAARWLRFCANDACLLALAVPFGTSLDFAPAAPSRDASPLRCVQRAILANHSRVGLLTNGSELRWLLCDDRACWHELVVTTDVSPKNLELLECSATPVLASLCRPATLTRSADLAQCVATHQANRLRQLGTRITQGLTAFLSTIWQAPQNSEVVARLVVEPAIAEALWQESLLFAFGTLLIARAELTLNRPTTTRPFSTPGWYTHYSPAHVISSQLETLQQSLSASTQPQFASQCLHLRAQVTAVLHPHSSHDSLDSLDEAGLAKFPTLSQFQLTEQASRTFLATLLIEPARVTGATRRKGGDRNSSGAPPRAGTVRAADPPELDSNAKRTARSTHFEGASRCDSARQSNHLTSFTLYELTHLFESFIEYRPQLAVSPMVRYRRGNREVVLRESSPVSKPGTPIAEHAEQTMGESVRLGNRCEEIATGSFYLTDVRGRKASGAFYTPQAIASLLTRQSIEVRLRDWHGDVESFLSQFAVLDPAMGVGAFLLEAATQLGEALFDLVTTTTPPHVPLDCLEPHIKTTPLATAIRARASSIAAIEAKTEQLTALGNLSNDAQLRLELLDACRAACSARCLFGVDKHPVAVMVARLALWSQSGCDDEVATSSRDHLIVGNSLIGPRLGDLCDLPIAGVPLTKDLSRDLQRICDIALSARTHRSNATTGVTHREANPPSQVQDPENASRVLQRLATVWSGAVLSGTAQNDDEYVALVRQVTQDEASTAPRLTPGALALSELCPNAVCFELCFPELFRRNADRGAPGFAVVLGNPPWDSVKHSGRDFLAQFDLRAFDTPTKRERDLLETELLIESGRSEALRAHVESFERLKRAHSRLFCHQKVIINGDLAGRQLDLFRLFIERGWHLLAPSGVLGFVVPSAFHTAAGAVGVRRMLFLSGNLVSYAGLRNTRRWFDISTGLEFGLLVAQRDSPPSKEVRFCFGLDGPESVVSGAVQWLTLPRSYFTKKNPFVTIPCVENRNDLDALLAAARSETTFEQFAHATHVELRSTPTSVHRTHEAKHFVNLPKTRDYRLAIPSHEQLQRLGAVLHEGATFGRFDDTWGTPPQYAVCAQRVHEVPRFLESIGHYRLVMRAIVGSSLHKSIAAVVTPGTLVANSALVEGFPASRPSYLALVATAVLNSSVASFLLSTSADLNINLFALRQMAWPRALPNRFLAHNALRLLSNHAGWWPLWQEQLCSSHENPCRPPPFPVIASAAERSRLHGSMDAVIARAYGLQRAQYATILARFGKDLTYEHGLACFDAIEETGEADYFAQQDPFFEVGLVETLPRSSFDTPIDRGEPPRSA